MARWTGDPTAETVLKAADAWRKRCVESDGSILSSESLWTGSNFSELKAKFLGNPIAGSDRDFYQKLQQQLEGASKGAIRLAAEVVWLLLLFPHHSKFGYETKLGQVRTVWEWGGTKIPSSDFLAEPYLKGIGNPGTAYLTRRYEQFGFVLEVFEKWKSLTSRERAGLLSDDQPWSFVEWVDQLPHADRRPVRNAILYFMFPDTLERNLSNDHRRQIFESFKDKVKPEVRPKSKNPSLLECDKAISSIRQHFEKTVGTSEIDFYRPPVYQLWWNGLREKGRTQVASQLKNFLSKYGLELRQCGNKKDKLTDCYPTNTASGYWEDPADATNKPLRWLLHIELVNDKLVARLPSLHGARRIAFANTAQGTTGAVTARIIPAIRNSKGKFTFYETWEWLLLLCFLPALAPGSSGQLFEFDPLTGEVKYMGKDQGYIHAALIALNEEEDLFASQDLARPLRYGEVTSAFASLINVVDR